MDWPKLVAERHKWVAHNFPDDGRGDRISVLGMIEEQGELVHAHIKKDQNIRGNEDHDANAKDAVGDLTIYLLGVMDYRKVDFEKFETFLYYRPVEQTDPDVILLRLAVGVGRIAAGAKIKGRTVGWDRRCAVIVKALIGYCKVNGWDYEQIVQETWEQVKQRDWIAYPETGRPPTVDAPRS
jgi:hypothetical protein